MSQWEQVELTPLFNKLIEAAKLWKPKEVLSNTVKLGKLVKHQLEDYFEGKYRKDRNEVMGYFEAIEKFAQTKLPISLDHFTQLTKDYKSRITPYPHYSGIVVQVPKNFEDIKDVEVSDIPEVDKTTDEDSSSTVKLV